MEWMGDVVCIGGTLLSFPRDNMVLWFLFPSYPPHVVFIGSFFSITVTPVASQRGGKIGVFC